MGCFGLGGLRLCLQKQVSGVYVLQCVDSERLMEET